MNTPQRAVGVISRASSPHWQTSDTGEITKQPAPAICQTYGGPPARMQPFPERMRRACDPFRVAGRCQRRSHVSGRPHPHSLRRPASPPASPLLVTSSCDIRRDLRGDPCRRANSALLPRRAWPRNGAAVPELNGARRAPKGGSYREPGAYRSRLRTAPES